MENILSFISGGKRRIGDGGGPVATPMFAVGYDVRTKKGESEDVNSGFTPQEQETMLRDFSDWIRQDNTIFYKLLACSVFYENLPAPQLVGEAATHYNTYRAIAARFNARQNVLRTNATEFEQGAFESFAPYMRQPYIGFPLAVLWIVAVVIVAVWIVDAFKKTEITRQKTESDTDLAAIDKVFAFVEANPSMAAQVLPLAKEAINKVSSPETPFASTVQSLMWVALAFVALQGIKAFKS